MAKETEEGGLVTLKVPDGVDRVVFDTDRGEIVIRIVDGAFAISVPGDLAIEAGGRLSLSGRAGVDVRTPAALNLEANGAATLRSTAVTTVEGGLVKIN